MNCKPYIGVTGFTTRQEVEEALSAMPGNSQRLLMVGILASYKTLNGRAPGNPKRYPDIHAIKNIFTDHPQALNLIHYNTKETEDLMSQLNSLTEEGGSCLHGFQLNICWPPDWQLIRFRENNPDMRIVLQISEKAFGAAEYSAKKLCSQINNYKDSITDVLLDSSGGTGKTLRPDFMNYYISAIRSLCPNIGIGVAGGLSSNTPHLIEAVALHYPDVSIDAEGRLRNIANDTLEIESVKLYIKRSLSILQ